ncbi:hypothetical protein WJX74_002074 [Apatococcus lobatus]|uniref:MSP domain-containing protein n=1 Tax=Apatococcus lobatus TaxID=904363 RepID=A0AAW1Q9R7_9CHLO
MAACPDALHLEPEELIFSSVRIGQAYCHTVKVTNTLEVSVEAAIRAGSPERYSLSPASIALKPGESACIDVRLRILRFAAKRKAIEQGQRDIFHIKATYFDQKFHSTFFLAPEPGTDTAKPQGGRTFSKQHAKLKQGADTSRQLAIITKQDQHALYSEAADDSAGFGSDLDGDHPAQQPTQLQLARLEPDEAQLDHLYLLVESQKAAMRDQDEMIRLLRRQAAEQERTAGHGGNGSPRGHAPMALTTPALGSPEPELQHQVSTLEAENARLQGACEQLRGRLYQADQDCAAHSREADSLRALQEELQGQAPKCHALIQAAVAQEKAQQETRNLRVLNLLRSKDEALQASQDRCTELAAQKAQMEVTLQEAMEKLGARESRLAEVLEGRAKLRKQLDQSHADFSAMQATMKAELIASQDVAQKEKARAAHSPSKAAAEHRAQKLRLELQESEAALTAARDHVQQLTQGLDTSNDDLQNQLQQAEREQQHWSTADTRAADQVQQLKQQVTDLQAILASEADRQQLCSGSRRPNFPSPTRSSMPANSMAAADLQHKIQELEEANDKLERALLEANRMRAMLATRPLVPASSGHGHHTGSHIPEKEVVPGPQGMSQAAACARCGSLEGQLQSKTAELGQAQKQCAHLQSSLTIAQAHQSTWDSERRSMQKTQDSNRLAAERMNARVSELAIAADGLRAELRSSQAIHSKATAQQKKLQDAVAASLNQDHDLAGMRGALQAIIGRRLSPTKALAGQLIHVHHGSEDSSNSSALSTPALQGTAATSKAGLQLEFEAFRAEAEAKQARLRLDVQQCRDEAAAEMQGLRDLNTTLAGRSNLHQELAQLGARLTAANKKASGLQLDLQATQSSLHAKTVEAQQLLEKLDALQCHADASSQTIDQKASAAQLCPGEHQQDPRMLMPPADPIFHKTELADLRSKLTEAGREVAAVHARLADAEAGLHEARRKVAKQQQEASQVEAQHAAACAKRELDSLQASEKQASQAAATALQAQQHAEAETADLKERLQILMETIETLQAGNAGEKDQRIVTLTAQMSAARLRETMLDRRSAESIADAAMVRKCCEEQKSTLERLQNEKEAATCNRQEADAAASASARRMQGYHLELNGVTLSLQKACSAADEAQGRAIRLQAEVRGMQEALAAASTHHHQQLSRERGEASAALKAAMQSAAAGPGMDGSPGVVAQGIDSIVAALHSINASRTASTDASAGVWTDIPQEILARMRTLLIVSDARANQSAADARMACSETASLMHKLRRAEEMLDSQVADIQKAVTERDALALCNEQVQVMSMSKDRMKHQDARLSALTKQLDETLIEEATRQVHQKNLQHDLTRQKQTLESKTAKISTLEAHVQKLEAELIAQLQELSGCAEAHGFEDANEIITRRDAGVRAWFEEETGRRLLSDDSSETIMALTREVCSLKLAQSQLAANESAARIRLAAAHKQEALLQVQVQALSARCTDLEERAHEGQMEDTGFTGMRQELAAKAAEVYDLQAEQLRLQQELSEKDAALRKCQRVQAGAASALTYERAHCKKRLEEACQKISSDFGKEKQELLHDLRTAHEDAKAAARGHEDAISVLADDNAAALAARPEPREHEEVIAAKTEALRALEEWETRCQELEAEVEVLQAEVQRHQMELANGRADAETRGAAVAGLEAMLTSLMKAAAQGRHPGSSTRLSTKQSKQEEAISMVTLSRQLVQAKLSDADAHRKLRVSAKAEVVLRLRLAERDARVDELKAALMRSRPQGLPRPGSRQMGRAQHVPLLLPAPPTVMPDAAATNQAAASETHLGAEHVAMQQTQDAAARSSLARECGDLRLEVAKRDAEIESLQGALAVAAACQEDDSQRTLLTHDQSSCDQDNMIRDLQRRVRGLQDACRDANTAARAALGLSALEPSADDGQEAGNPFMQVHCDQLGSLVDLLASKLREKDAQIRRVRMGLKAAEDKAAAERADAAASPLDTAQRSVIRNLGLKVSSLSQQIASLKEERNLAQARLRALRASLGARSSAEDTEQLPALPAAAGQVSNPAMPGPRQESNLPDQPKQAASEAEGLCQLLEHHLNALEAAQKPLQTLQHPCEESSAEGGQVPSDSRWDPAEMVPRIISATCACVTEIYSMRATLRVLSSGLDSLSYAPQASSAQPSPVAGAAEQPSQPPGTSQQIARADAAAQTSHSSVPSSPEHWAGFPSPHSSGTGVPSEKPGSVSRKSHKLHRETQTDGKVGNPADHGSPGRPASPRLSSKQPEEGSGLEAVQHRATSLDQGRSRSPKSSTSLSLGLYPEQHENCARSASAKHLGGRRADHSTALVVHEGFADREARREKERAGKWKTKCQKLREQVASMQAAAAAAESAWKERLAAIQQAAETSIKEDKRLAGPDAQPPQQQEQTAAIRDAAVAAMRATEAEARCDVLQRQADTLRAQSTAVQASLQERVESLTGSLAQEKNERGKIVTSLRETIHGLRRAGDVEGRLKTELIQQHELLAAAKAAQEQAEAKAAHRKADNRAARDKIDSLQQHLSKQMAEAEMADHLASLRLSGVQQELKSLSGRLASADALRAQLETSLQARISQAVSDIEQDLKVPPALEESMEHVQRMAEAVGKKVLDLEQHQHAAERETELAETSKQTAREHQLDQELHRARQRLQKAEEECKEACSRAADLQHDLQAEIHRLQKQTEHLQISYDQERQSLIDKHAAQLNQVEGHMEAERKALKQAASAAAATAAASAEERAKATSHCRVKESERRALQDITNAQAAQQQLISEIDDIRSQFKAYQQVKSKEVAALEARLRHCLAQPQDPGKASKYSSLRRPQQGAGAGAASHENSSWTLLAGLPRGKADTSNLNAACEVASAMESESILAALREANFERLERESAEAAAAAAHEAADKLRAKLKATQKDIASLREEAAAAAAEASHRPSAEALQKAQEQAQVAQQDLKAARAESSRRLKALQDLQRCCDDTCLPIPASAMAAERAAREAAESKASATQASLARKTQLVADLRKRVTDLEESVVRASIKESPSSSAVGSEARIKAQQAALQRRDEMLRELRDRLDQAGRDMAVMREAEDAQLATVRKLKADLARRDTQLKDSLHSVNQAQMDAASQSAAAEAQQESMSTKLRVAAAHRAACQRMGRQLLDALDEAAQTVLQCSWAIRSSVQDHDTQAPDWRTASSETIARMVNLDLDDLEEVVGGNMLHSHARPRQDADEQQVSRLLQNLHEVAADLLSDASQAKQSCHMSWRLQQDMCHDLLTKLLQELHQLSERSQRKMTSTSSAAFPRSQNVTRVSSREDPRFSQGSWETNTLHRPLHLADGDCSLNSIDQLQAELWQAECGLHDI